MRFKDKRAANGDMRERTFFAWLPVTSEKTGETRWFERVNVLERYFEGIGGASEPRIYRRWDVVEFTESA